MDGERPNGTINGRPRIAILVCVVFPVMTIAPTVFARVAVKAPRQAEDKRIDAEGSGVYLDDSFEAADALMRVDPLVRARKWRQAAELMQQISDEFGNKLIRRDPGYYVGLRQYINEQIAGWPPAGLEAYRSLFEREVAASVDRRSDPAHADPADDLLIVERYFCTKAAFDLAERTAQRAIEAGDFPLAEHVYRRLLDEHPDGAAEANRLRAMLAIVRALLGAERKMQSSSDHDPQERSEAKVNKRPSPQRTSRLLRSETPPDGAARVRWKGQDLSLENVLSTIGTDFSALHEAEEESWPIFSGAPHRNRSSRCAVDELGVQWRFTFKDGEKDEEEPANDDVDDALAPGEIAPLLTVYPVVSEGLVFAQRHRVVVALRRNTGELVWRFGGNGSASGGGGYMDDPPTEWDSVTVVGDRVYVSLPGEGESYYGYVTSRTPNELVCLDAHTGRVVWRVSERSLPPQFADIVFDSSPLVEHGRLHIVGRRRRSFGFEDAYLFRLDARTGRVLTHTHIGSASTGTYGLQPATKAVAAWHGDTVYVCSNLGSIAAVSAYTGAVRWVRLYRRIEREGGSRSGIDVAPWHYNPVLWTVYGLVVLPMDGADLLILAPDTGRTLQAIPRSRLADAVSLLGLHDGLLCTAGGGAACYDLHAQRLAWSKPPTNGATLIGRGVWADDRLLLPTTKGLSVFQVSDGSRRDLPWDPEGGPGNLLALPDQLLVAGARQLTAYVRKSEIWNALRARLNAAPDDPLPALELAEVAMRGGETEAALDALDQAVARIANAPGMPQEGVRKRVFDDALSFARTLAERGRLSAETLDRLFVVASTFPGVARDHLEYRLRFAHMYRAIDRPRRAIRLYQQVLRDRSLRDLPLESKGHPAVRAASYCAARIEELIAEHGDDIYAPFEQEAQRLLNQAKAEESETALARVVESYPNSRAAPQALIARGALLSRQGRPVEAVRLLIQAYHKYRGDIDRPALLKQIADTLEWAGRRADAFRWLTKAALEHPSAIIEDRGERLTFLQYRNRLNDVRDAVEPQRPILFPPLTHAFERVFAAPMALLVPKFPEDAGLRWSRGFVYANGLIYAIDPRTGADIWKEPLPVRESVDLLTHRDDKAVFATSFEVFAVDPEKGRRIWSYGTHPPELDRPDADWEDVDAIRSYALNGDLLVAAFDGGRVAAVDLRNGRELWSRTLSPPPAEEFTLNGRRLAYYAMPRGEVAIGLVNAADGSWIDLIVTDEQGVPLRLFQTLDEQVVLVTAHAVSAYDADRRILRWRVATGNRFRETSVLLDLDAVYLSPDGRDLRKISLEDGRVLWELVGLLGRDEDRLTLRRVDAQLLVTTSASVVSVDAVSGMILWRGTTPPEPQFREWMTARDFLVGIDESDGGPEDPSRAFFYDLRNASGVIPSEGASRIGGIDDLRRILLLDGALLYQNGPTTIRGFSGR